LGGSGRILDDTGADVTEAFRLGAKIALEMAVSQGCRFALLTDGSPSCGTSFVYSGRSNGVVAALLAENGIAVFSEREIALASAKPPESLIETPCTQEPAGRPAWQCRSRCHWSSCIVIMS
jgi:uncharacterized protein YbbK (DUF523 family)